MMKKNINQKVISIIEYYKMINLDMIISNDPITRYKREKNMYVGTSTQSLKITNMQPEGKKTMKASDFINGLNLNQNKEISFEYR